MAQLTAAFRPPAAPGVRDQGRKTKDGTAESVLRPSSFVLPAAIAAAYLLTRLIHLGQLPMVSDEGTYLTWGVRALHATVPEEWLASLEDGKQPLLAWLFPPFLAALPDRLIAGRLVSVLTGLANLALLVVLGRRLFGRAAGWVAAGLYVVAPIALVHDRMALYDSLVATTALGTLWAALAWAGQPSARRTLALGLALGAAVLTKLSALFFVVLVPVVVALWRPAALRRWWLLAQAFFLTAAIYSVLYLSPLVGNIQDGNFQRYSLTGAEVLALPLRLWAKNARFIGEAAGVYLGWPLAVLCLAGGLWSAIRRGRAGRIAALWTFLPMLAFVLTAKIIYSRYVVFCFVAALLPAADVLVTASTIARRGRTLLLLALLLACAVPGLAFTARLLSDPVAAPWMDDRDYITDRFQYVESNYAGYGLPEIVGFLRQRAATEPVVVLVRDVTGMPRDGVTAYLLDWPNVEVGFVPENEAVEARLRRQPDRAYQLAARGADVYFVLSDAPDGDQVRRFRSLNPDAMLVLDVPKPGNHSRFQLYRLPLHLGQGDTWLDPPALLGDAAALDGFGVSHTTVQPGDTIRLALYWHARRRAAVDYTVFTHVEGAKDSIWAQQDAQPAGGTRPTSRWRPGESIPDIYQLVVKPETAPGTYELVIGMYDLKSGRRVSIEGSGAVADRLVLGSITVVAAAPAADS